MCRIVEEYAHRESIDTAIKAGLLYKSSREEIIKGSLTLLPWATEEDIAKHYDELIAEQTQQA